MIPKYCLSFIVISNSEIGSSLWFFFTLLVFRFDIHLFWWGDFFLCVLLLKNIYCSFCVFCSFALNKWFLTALSLFLLKTRIRHGECSFSLGNEISTSRVFTISACLRINIMGIGGGNSFQTRYQFLKFRTYPGSH